MFAVTYRDNNQVRVFDSSTYRLLRTYQNPEAQLDWPHGLTVTDKHIIVSNKHNSPNKPSIFNIYRIDDPSGEPAKVFTTPIEHLRVAHSHALKSQRLLVTYAGGAFPALASYRFDDETGEISGPIDSQESWFKTSGKPKGVCFNDDGTKAFVTFITEKRVKYRFFNKYQKARNLLRKKNGARNLIRVLLSEPRKLFTGFKTRGGSTDRLANGIAIFDVDENGMLSKEPVQTILKSDYCRLENINIAEGLCAVADAVNGKVELYELDGDAFPEKPTQVIQENLFFPHDACLSPDRKILVIANDGIEVKDTQIRWYSFVQPRGDNVKIYELQK
ncbi:MAG: hypothetical protein ABFS45_12770 [Pseudomonadota bacterium]